MPHAYLLYIVYVVAVTRIESIYLRQETKSYFSQPKENEIIIPSRSYQPVFSQCFKSDQEIGQYLKLYGDDMMIWRCKNAIKRTLERGKRRYLDLYCEVIGRVDHVIWSRDNMEITPAKHFRYEELVHPHFEDGHYFSLWIEFRLRIFRARRHDSGVYTFKVVSPGGLIQTEQIHVQVEKPPKSSRLSKMKKKLIKYKAMLKRKSRRKSNDKSNKSSNSIIID